MHAVGQWTPGTVRVGTSMASLRPLVASGAAEVAYDALAAMKRTDRIVELWSVGWISAVAVRAHSSRQSRSCSKLILLQACHELNGAAGAVCGA